MKTREFSYNELYDLVDHYLLSNPQGLTTYQDKQALAAITPKNRLAAALCALLTVWGDASLSLNSEVSCADLSWLDVLLGQLNQTINQQVDSILHHPEFQALESTWRSVQYLVDRVERNSPVKIEVLDLSQEELRQDFMEAADLSQSGLYHHLYHMEYDMPGGDPMSAMVSDYTFKADAQDVKLLQRISAVSEMTHCPFLGNVSAQFFQKQSFNEVLDITDLKAYLERAEYVDWSAFRNLDCSRYIGLLLPKFLLRLPYGQDNPVRGFCYDEAVEHNKSETWLWGGASFAFAANMIRSFTESGWLINVRGPESGGKVPDLPIPKFAVGGGLFCKAPTEVLISESKELQLSNLGFIPLCYYKNSNFACFFSANSVQMPTLYAENKHTANSRVNARLPYVFLVSRLGHYLKVLQREVIGAEKSAMELQQELNAWLQTLVTKMHDPAPDMAVRYPLREGTVSVNTIANNPGYFKVDLFVVPHFQVEGVDIRLSLVAKLPSNAKDTRMI